MRASRLLQILLLLQNRGRMTSRALAAELEVTRRTVLRDVDALTEAGLPVVVSRGIRGGIELGFNYRSRLTGLSTSEAEALGVLLGAPAPALEALGLGTAGRVAKAKLLESLPDGVREAAVRAQAMFRIEGRSDLEGDLRLAPLAKAVREARVVRIRARSSSPRAIHPVALVLRGRRWSVIDGLNPGHPIAVEECGDLNISAIRFTRPTR